MSDKKKFHIVLDFENSKGGGTSFLSYLKSELIKKNLYTDKWYLADTILINSHHISKFKATLIKLFGKRIVHRIDGPMRVYNNAGDSRDDQVVWLNTKIASATVFQSEWSYQQHEKLYGKVKSEVSVIHNVANPEFYRPTVKEFKGGKLKLISTVWSTHINKGYETYEWLDKNLDFTKFSFELIGAKDGQFKNIKCLPYMQPEDLSKKLQEAHVYIFPSKFEACSNALLEALATGLPCVTYKGSSNVEVIKDESLWFSEDAEVGKILENMYERYESYLPKTLPSAEDTVERYIEVLKG